MSRSYMVFPALLALMMATSSHAAITKNPAELLISNSHHDTQIIEDLRHLTTKIGGRPTGSAAMQNAMQWSVKQFKAAGLNNAHLEEYTPPVNWLPHIESGALVNNAKPLHIAMMPFSANTSKKGLMADVYAISSLDPNEITANADKIKNHWLLIPTPEINSVENFMLENLMTTAMFHAAENAGAAGILWMSSHAEKRLYRHNAAFNGTLSPLPGAVIEREEAQYLQQLLQKGKRVTVNIALRGETQVQPRNYNVVAEIPGYEKPDEVIIIGAHLDSWDLGQGALDNGCNAALVLDVARRIKLLEGDGLRPRRTIRFMLFSGEEEGLYGSWFDAKKRANELDQIKAVVIHDLGSGRTMGYSLGGREDMLSLVNNALQSASAKFGPLTQTLDADLGTDNFDYLLKGIPTLVANQDPTPYFAHYHSNTDTFENVDLQQLKDNTSIATILGWNLANTTEVFPRRLGRAEVDALLKKTGLDEEMKAADITYRD